MVAAPAAAAAAPENPIDVPTDMAIPGLTIIAAISTTGATFLKKLLNLLYIIIIICF
jgi:hypothetical protein